MDKNRDFIRVDDVFKSLGNGEEQYRSGAWGQMKDLLDKEMPLATGTASRGSMYRYLIPLLVLMLAAGTSYYLWNHSENKEMTENAQPMVVTTASSDHQTNASVSSGTLAPKQHQQTSGNNQKPGDSHSEKALASVGIANTTKHPESFTKKENNQNFNNNRKGKSLVAEKQDVGHNDRTNHATVSMAGNGNHAKQQPVEKIKNKGSVPEIVTVNAAVQNGNDAKGVEPLSASNISPEKVVVNSDIQKRTISSDIATLQKSLPVLQKETVLQQIKPAGGANTGEKSPLNATEELAQKNQLKKVASINNKTIYQSDNGGWYKEQKDTFKQLKLVRRPNDNALVRENVKPIYDTLSESRIAKVSFIPLTFAEIKSYQLEPVFANIALIPNAKMTAKGTVSNTTSAEQNLVNLVPLQQYKVSSRQMDAGAISRLLHSANSGISGLMDGSKNWYVSLLVGGNAGLGSPNTYGMQFGASFLYSIAERWTLSLGLQYQNNYYSNFRFWDSAINYALQEEKTPNGTKFFGTESVNQTSVNVNSLSRLNLPVLLSYNLGRVSIFAGPEFSYFFTLNHQKSNSVQTNAVSKMTYDNKNPFIEQASRLDPTTDFRSRFAAGYSFGLSYDFSRKVSVDVRLNQMLWDNTGKYKLDALRNIYHQPAVEVNLDFFLGRRDKVIYIMDKNR